MSNSLHDRERHRTLDNALKLVLALAERRFGMDYKEIMTLLRTSKRNVYRYLDVLQRVGVRLDKRKEQGTDHNWHRLVRLIDIRGYKLAKVLPRDT